MEYNKTLTIQKFITIEYTNTCVPVKSKLFGTILDCFENLESVGNGTLLGLALETYISKIRFKAQ